MVAIRCPLSRCYSRCDLVAAAQAIGVPTTAAGASEQTIAQGLPKPSELSSAMRTTFAPDAALALSTECDTRSTEIVSSGAVPATSLA